ncbi:MAG: GNAT family N-acetyltransferase, partial [Eubacterium sp.]
MGINMTEIRYASMADKELLLSRDCHIKEDILEKAILNRYVLVMLAGGNLAGWLRWGLFWDEIPFMNMLYFLEEYRGLGFGTQLVGFWENEMLKL